MAVYYWLIVFVVMIGIEFATVSLTSIWFAGGAFAGLIVSALGGSVRLQLGAFVAVSFLLILMVRPLAGRALKEHRTRTGTERLVGRKVTVQEKIDNAAGTGTVAVDGQIWLARTSEEGKTYDKGTVVEIEALEGAKLMVKAPAGI